MESKILIIAGMHRSTTTLTAKWLQSCGINIGDKLLEGDIGNSEGHYEDMDFLKLHMDILHENGLPGGGVIFPNQREFDFDGFNKIEISDYYREKAIASVEFKSRLHKEFAWKEPRTCLFLPFYADIIPDAKYLFIS